MAASEVGTCAYRDTSCGLAVNGERDACEALPGRPGSWQPPACVCSSIAALLLFFSPSPSPVLFLERAFLLPTCFCFQK